MERQVNLAGKTFILLQNSAHGSATSETIVRWKKEEEVLTAVYTGGAIIYGRIVGLQHGMKLNLLYHCLTVDNELKAGKAIADISFAPDEKLRLDLDWEWLDGGEKGHSAYVEK